MQQDHKTYHAFAFLMPAALDTIDHNILITRLSSWFGIHGSVFSWFKYYLSSRFFRVKCNNNLSSVHTSCCGVPQGSVLSPTRVHSFIHSFIHSFSTTWLGRTSPKWLIL